MRIIKALYRRLCSLVKLTVVKVFQYKNFEYKFISLVSCSTKFKFYGKGKIILGNKVATRRNVEISVYKNGEIIIGSNSFFNNNCMIVSHQQIIIGENCSFGPNVVFFDHDHDFRSKDGVKGNIFKTGSILIGNNVWIGANTTILRDTIIEDGCVIGAGAVIKGIVKKNSLVIPDRKNKVSTYLINE